MSDSKTIAKNTVFLYLRMLLTMGVSLYTSRVVLDVLGVEDYGIYSLVGGIVLLFAFFNSAMSSATQRFLAYDIGRKDDERLRNTFNATLFIHVGIAILILILAETIGLWFVNNKLNFPIARIEAIRWIYQFSVFTFLIGVVQVPFNSLIIARERMNVYALMSIIEVVLKLIIVYVLVVFDYDKLKLYATLIFIVSLIVALFYQLYCLRYFKEARLKWYYDKQYFNTLIAYSGWNLFGNIAGVAKGQGVNIVLNLFFGVGVNAAYGIMLQVQGAVNAFVTNFQLAVNPQIIKSYASNDRERTMWLIFKSSKFSFFLLLMIALPIIYNIDFVLQLWLKNPPPYSASFVKLCLINILIDSISGPLMTGAQATGKIKWYQIIVGSLVFLNLPVAYILLSITKVPDHIFYVSIVISLITFNFRIFFLKAGMNMSFRAFYKHVVFRIVAVTSIILTLLYLASINYHIEKSLIIVITESSIITVVLLLLVLTIGMDKDEKINLRGIAIKMQKKWLKRI